MLPPGPSEGALAQTLRLHIDPLASLRGWRSRHGDLFTLRLVTARPIVVVCAPELVEPILTSDPAWARAGEARRRILPMASPCSAFGGDEPQHGAAAARVAPALAPDAVHARVPAMVAIAERHADGWPRGRPFRLLPRMRALVDEVFARVLLGVRDESRLRVLAHAMGRMLWTPGNPPLSIPGEGDGVVGAVAAAAFERRAAPLKALLAQEIESRREHADDVIGCLASSDQPTEALVDELLPLLMAAQEPAAAALTWVLERHARQPELEPGDEAVIRETLRLRPPAIAALRRLVVERDLDGHRLPAGVTLMLPAPVLQRDQRSFPEPDEFRPERWASAPEGTYLPFGGGSRRCAGEHLADAYLRALVPAILRRVTLRPAWPSFERMILRGTILVPHRSALVRAR